MARTRNHKRPAQEREKLTGARALELANALGVVTNVLAERVGREERSLATMGPLTKEDQEIIGLWKILEALYPFAMEVALKALWELLHRKGGVPRVHDLRYLFDQLAVDPDALAEARRVQGEARAHWKQLIHDGVFSSPHADLDAFLDAHSHDFERLRYYERPKTKGIRRAETKELQGALWSLIAPMVTRDSTTCAHWATMMNDIPPLPQDGD